jgi:hypothetical protein
MTVSATDWEIIPVRPNVACHAPCVFLISKGGPSLGRPEAVMQQQKPSLTVLLLFFMQRSSRRPIKTGESGGLGSSPMRTVPTRWFTSATEPPLGEACMRIQNAVNMKDMAAVGYCLSRRSVCERVSWTLSGLGVLSPATDDLFINRFQVLHGSLTCHFTVGDSRRHDNLTWQPAVDGQGSPRRALMPPFSPRKSKPHM